MNAGMRVRRGLLAALMMFAVPLAATLAAMLLSPPAVAQGVSSAVSPSRATRLRDKQLSAEIQSRPRGTLSRPMIQSDTQRITEIRRCSGRHELRDNPAIIEQPNNRVDLVFTITEGANATTA
jgi:outer membrane protein assembly factor BamA